MIIGISIVFGIYLLIMLFLSIGMQRMPEFSTKTHAPNTKFSIIIPFRNEEENLTVLIETIEKLQYPKELFEVIFIDDDSEDSSEEIIKNRIQESEIEIRLIRNRHVSNSPKKDAISLGIKNSNFDWILTTDADCSLPKNWLDVLDAFIQEKNPVLIAAPVLYQSTGSFLQDFQLLDGLSLQAVSIGSFGYRNPLLCNGANLAYTKKSFYEVNGFTGNDQIASGDDIFMLEKMKKRFPKQVKFLKTKRAIVTTNPQGSWRNVIDQRIRWASKTSKQKNIYSLLIGILVFIVNISFLLIPLFILLNPKHFVFYLGLLILKLTIDYTVLRQTANFFQIKIKLSSFLLQTFIYAIIIVKVVFGSFKSSYSWKGREFKNPR